MANAHWTAEQDDLRAIISAPRFGLLSDFDGTLSEFRPYPDRPQMTDRNVELLVALAARLPLVALLSGRGARELQKIVQLPGIAYIGNHGMEELREDRVIVTPAAHDWEDRLSAFVRELGEPTIPGVHYQPKGITMSIMYRHAHQPTEARLQILERLQQVNEKFGFTFFEGKSIWEVRPPIEADKGTALAALIEEYQLDSALFLGDDVTDVAGMQMLKHLREDGRVKGLAIGVMGDVEVAAVRETADVLADNVEDVEKLLDWVLNNLSVSPGG